jgi:hypothetical protein
MPKPEQIVTPKTSVYEPVVKWDSTMTVSKWRLGAQSGPVPEETLGITLEPSQVHALFPSPRLLAKQREN